MVIHENSKEYYDAIAESHMRLHLETELMTTAKVLLAELFNANKEQLESIILETLVNVAMDQRGGTRTPVNGPQLARLTNEDGKKVDVYLQPSEELSKEEVANLVLRIWTALPDLMGGVLEKQA
jgi:hypothetical protein